MSEENVNEIYRPELPPIPKRMRSLPVRRGYPVPWFVAQVDGDYYFPAADGTKLMAAVKKRLCWACGQKLGGHLAFVIGPMCAVNRVTSEPPCHRECAVFSATACPFLSRPKMKRREDMPEEASPAPGIHIDRNPGAALVWVTKKFWIRPMPRDAFNVNPGFLFRIGEPEEVLWFAQGRAATRAEVMESIDSGYPILHGIAEQEGRLAVEELHRLYARALELVPA